MRAKKLTLKIEPRCHDVWLKVFLVFLVSLCLFVFAFLPALSIKRMIAINVCRIKFTQLFKIT